MTEGAVTVSNVEDVFSYHAPRGDFQIEKYHRLRQAGKVCALVMLNETDPDLRKAALVEFKTYIQHECGDCRDRHEAEGLIDAGLAFESGMSKAFLRSQATPMDVSLETTQMVISCIRSALMWANASVALGARI